MPLVSIIGIGLFTGFALTTAAYCRWLKASDKAESNLVRLAMESLGISVLLVVAPSLFFEGVEAGDGWSVAGRVWVLLSIAAAAAWPGIRIIDRGRRYLVASALITWLFFFLPCVALGYVQDVVTPPVGEPGVSLFLLYAGGMVVLCPAFPAIALAVNRPGPAWRMESE